MAIITNGTYALHGNTKQGNASSSPPTATVWGSITGDINNQTDLINRTDTVHIDTTANWNAQPNLIGKLNHIYVYSDYQTVNGVSVPGIKVGDGLAYLIDAPFIAGNDTALNAHINDANIHVTSTERLFWNNKVTCFLSQGDDENIVFTKEDING